MYKTKKLEQKEWIVIKRLIPLLIILSLFLLTACGSTKNISETKPLSVSIESDIDTYEKYQPSVRGITLTPKLDGTTNKDIKYHWKIDSDTEMFYTESGTKKEIINSGEPVLFVITAEINYARTNGLSKSTNITLAVEEKDSNNILAETKLVIEDYSGTYKVKK